MSTLPTQLTLGWYLRQFDVDSPVPTISKGSKNTVKKIEGDPWRDHISRWARHKHLMTETNLLFFSIISLRAEVFGEMSNKTRLARVGFQTRTLSPRTRAS